MLQRQDVSYRDGRHSAYFVTVLIQFSLTNFDSATCIKRLLDLLCCLFAVFVSQGTSEDWLEQTRFGVTCAHSTTACFLFNLLFKQECVLGKALLYFFVGSIEHGHGVFLGQNEAVTLIEQRLLQVFQLLGCELFFFACDAQQTRLLQIWIHLVLLFVNEVDAHSHVVVN